MFSPANLPVLHFDDINGRPLVGGKLYAYEAGTNTPAPTYTNVAGTEFNTNPIVLNERGECRMYLKDGLMYKLVLKDRHDAVVWEADNLTNVDFFVDIEPSDGTLEVEKREEGHSYHFKIKVSSALMERIREIEEKVKPRNFYNGAVFDPSDENAEGREGLVDSDGAIIGFFDF